MLNALFGGFREIRKLEAEKAVLEKENKAAAKREEERLESERRTRVANERAVEDLNRRHRQELEDIKFENGRILRNADANITDVDESAERRIAKAEAETDRVKANAASEVKLAKLEAKAEAREEFGAEIHELESSLANEVANTAAAEARSDERNATIEVLQGQVSDYKEFVQFVLNKVPDIDMSSFKIDVTMPAPEVTVINGGAKPEAKQEQKKS